jgi:MurNAc alpha-1-phosphate uridylyltransferase
MTTTLATAIHPTPAIVLAAGRGERMRPLTDTTPKPLLAVRGQPLLMWHVQALLDGGFERLVINTAWLGEKIHHFLGTLCATEQNGLPPQTATTAADILFSDERAEFGQALETAGGIARALPLLFPQATPGQPSEQDVFWVVAGDVFVPGFAFSQASVMRFRASNHLAHLWLVPNPAHNPAGDFGLSADGLALNLPKLAGAGDTADIPRYTYSTIGLYRAELFSAPWCDIAPGNPHGTPAPLAPLLRRAMDAGRVSAELYLGEWTDVGTPERLAQLNAPAD